MQEPQQLQTFIEFIQDVNHMSGIVLPEKWQSLPDVDMARCFLSGINRYFFGTNHDLRRAHAPDEEFYYISEFHKFWESHHAQMIEAEVVREQAAVTARALADAVSQHGWNVMNVKPHNCHLAPSATAQVRFFTTNQDFCQSLIDPIQLYLDDPAQFSAAIIADDPLGFLSFLGLTRLSQTDKRLDFARNAARLLIRLKCDAFGLAAAYGNDAAALRTALVSEPNMGYGLKKANMFIRDMVELSVWPDLTNFDAIDVASDINTMKLALRTRILRTSMPLVSSFLDIFCYQYGCIDHMSASAWRVVWEEWRKIDADAPRSPSQLDYLLYSIGGAYCRPFLVQYRCDSGHEFHHFGAQLRICGQCASEGRRSPARPVARMLPCQVDPASLPRAGGELMLREDNMLRVFDGCCMFQSVCRPNEPDFCKLDPPNPFQSRDRLVGRAHMQTSVAAAAD